jgi:hypothetical protein
MNTLKKTTVITAIFFTLLFPFLPFGGVGRGEAYAQMPGTPYVFAQSSDVCAAQSTEGTDFWLTFGPSLNGAYNVVYLEIRISASQNAQVTLTFNADNTQATYTVAAGTVRSIPLNAVQGNVAPNNTNLGDKRQSVYIPSISNNSGVLNNTLHIISTTPISVYAFNTRNASTDATLILPTSGWGDDYYNLSYRSLGSGDYDIVIANQQNTQLNVGGTVVQINAGQLYFVSSLSDQTGKHITADKPVAYFSHAETTNIPFGRVASDILYEQLMPINKWGTRFLVPNAPQNFTSPTLDFNNRIRMIASETGTTVTYQGATLVTGLGSAATFSGSGGTLNAGQWVELQIDGDPTTTQNTASAYISANRPIEVAAYMVGTRVSPPLGGGDSNILQYGDPAIAYIPPLNQVTPNTLISPFLFSTKSNPNTVLDEPNAMHYMIIMAPTDVRTQTAVTVNGVPVTLNPAGWVTNTASGFSHYIHTFNNTADLGKSFVVSGPEGIIVLCAGIGQAESYYYNAGSGTCVRNL